MITIGDLPASLAEFVQVEPAQASKSPVR